tara:strand:+ start:2211 stop:3083 length:873 start_codon:yes stop_codon:yes gene_type:complete
MSELTTIDANNYAAMAQMMGVAYDAQERKSSVSRLKIVKQSIMGDAEVNGKTIKAEVVSAGAMGLENGEKQSIYADSVVIRPFLQRFMYQRYDNDKKTYQKTVMSNNMDIDLKDSFGTFNCGKPSGYIKDFNALSDDVKTLIRTIKRTRVVFGTVTMNGVTADGNTMDVENLPFVWDVDTKEGFKNVGEAFGRLARQNRLPISHAMNVSTEKRDLPTGNSFWVPVLDVDTTTSFEITDMDQELMGEFMAQVESHNKWVMGEWDKAYQDNTPEPESDVVDEFITVEEADVD